MKKLKTYVIRVHENEFKYIKKDSPVLLRLLKMYKKRQKRYAEVAKNEPERRRTDKVYRDNRTKQLAAVTALGGLIRSRRPAGESADPLEKDLTEYTYEGKVSLMFTWHKLEQEITNRRTNKLYGDQSHLPREMRKYTALRIYGRPDHLLQNLGLSRLNDFRRVTPAELCAVPGIGAGTVKRLMASLKECGITMGDLVPTTAEAEVARS
jgi:hypothetical protein